MAKMEKFVKNIYKLKLNPNQKSALKNRKVQLMLIWYFTHDSSALIRGEAGGPWPPQNFQDQWFLVLLAPPRCKNQAFLGLFRVVPPRISTLLRRWYIKTKICNQKPFYEATCWFSRAHFTSFKVLSHPCPPQNFWPLRRAFKWSTM